MATRTEMQSTLKAYREQGIELLIKLNTTNEVLDQELQRIFELRSNEHVCVAEPVAATDAEKEALFETVVDMYYNDVVARAAEPEAQFTDTVATSLVWKEHLTIAQLHTLADIYGIEGYASLDRHTLCEKIQSSHTGHPVPRLTSVLEGTAVDSPTDRLNSFRNYYLAQPRASKYSWEEIQSCLRDPEL